MNRQLLDLLIDYIDVAIHANESVDSYLSDKLSLQQELIDLVETPERQTQREEAGERLNSCIEALRLTEGDLHNLDNVHNPKLTEKYISLAAGQISGVRTELEQLQRLL